MSENILGLELIDIRELEPSPIMLTIHSIKKITHLEKLANTSLELLPALEVAILPNKKKYVIKEYAVFEVLRKIGKTEAKAKIHFVNNLTQVIILHFQLSQSDPLNPLAVLDMRDYLITNGFSIDKIVDNCIMEPAYVNLLKCDLVPEARNKLSLLVNMLAKKLNRVDIPVYVIEIISKRPKEVQKEIVDRIYQYINDEKTITEKDFTFPNQMQIKLYAEMCKRSEKRNGLIFRDEEITESDSTGKKSSYLKNNSISKQNEIDNIVGNIPHMAFLEIEGEKIRIDWKAKTFAKINEQENGFIIIRDKQQMKEILALSDEQIKFLGLSQEQYPHYNNITSAKQLKKIAAKITNSSFRAILIFNNL